MPIQIIQQANNINKVVCNETIEIEEGKQKKASEHEDESNDISCIYYISLVSGIILGCGATSIYCLVPQHNILEEPQFWYEPVILTSIVWAPFVSACSILTSVHVTKIYYAHNFTSFLILSVVGIITKITSTVIYYILWTYHLQLFVPMVSNGIVSGTMAIIAVYVAFWLRYITIGSIFSSISFIL